MFFCIPSPNFAEWQARNMNLHIRSSSSIQKKYSEMVQAQEERRLSVWKKTLGPNPVVTKSAKASKECSWKSWTPGLTSTQSHCLICKSESGCLKKKSAWVNEKIRNPHCCSLKDPRLLTYCEICECYNCPIVPRFE